MKSGSGRLIVALIVVKLAILGSSLTSAAAPDLGLNLRLWLDAAGASPPNELLASRFYEFFDLELKARPVSGHVQLQAFRGGDVRHETALASVAGTWVDHLTARLFRDELEIGPAEYDIHFSRSKAAGAVHDGEAGPMVVGNYKLLDAWFTLSGPDGAALESGTYRLWIILDMRDPTSGQGLFAVSEAEVDPDLARKGGIVFAVQQVGSDSRLKARYLARLASALELEAQRLEEEKLRKHRGKDEFTPPAGDRQRRRAIELALQAYQASPRDPEVLAILARNYTRLGDCDSALRYANEASKVQPYLLGNDALGCVTDPAVSGKPPAP